MRESMHKGGKVIKALHNQGSIINFYFCRLAAFFSGAHGAPGALENKKSAVGLTYTADTCYNR